MSNSFFVLDLFTFLFFSCVLSNNTAVAGGAFVAQSKEAGKSARKNGER